VADRDAPGLAFAVDVAAQLEGVAASVKIVGAAAGKDAADHLENGMGVEDFVEWQEPLLPTSPDVVSPSGEAGSSEVGVYVIHAEDRRRRRIDWLWRKMIPRGAVVGFY